MRAYMVRTLHENIRYHAIDAPFPDYTDQEENFWITMSKNRALSKVEELEDHFDNMTFWIEEVTVTLPFDQIMT